MPTSTTATSTGASANAANPIAVSTSKYDSGTGRSLSTSSRYGAMSSYASTNRSVADRLPVQADPLGRRAQVRGW